MLVFRSNLAATFLFVALVAPSTLSNPTPNSNAEPPELPPAWAGDGNPLETNLWANQPIPTLKWTRKLDREIHTVNHRTRVSSDDQTTPTAGEL